MAHLLRAIRNKRNHIWTLGANVRAVLGESDDAMSHYWNSRYPGLLPLAYILARCYLCGVSQFQRFLPPNTSPLSEQMADLLISTACRPVTPAAWTRLKVNPLGCGRKLICPLMVAMLIVGRRTTPLPTGLGSPARQLARTRSIMQPVRGGKPSVFISGIVWLVSEIIDLQMKCDTSSCTYRPPRRVRHCNLNVQINLR